MAGAFSNIALVYERFEEIIADSFKFLKENVLIVRLGLGWKFLMGPNEPSRIEDFFPLPVKFKARTPKSTRFGGWFSSSPIIVLLVAVPHSPASPAPIAAAR
jgi:hypothetical protein